MATQPSPSPFAYRADRTVADANGTPLARCYADRNEAANGPLFAASAELRDALNRLVIFHSPTHPEHGAFHEGRVAGFMRGRWEHSPYLPEGDHIIAYRVVSK